MLVERELSGYDIWKELSIKGIKVRTNYLYMVLADMLEKEELLKARWIDNAKGPRRHIFGLSKKGHDEFRSQVKDSIDLIMAAFMHANLSTQDIPDHVKSVKRLFSVFNIPIPSAGTRFVLTTPSFDPSICYPISFYVLGEAFPSASISVVKPPGTNYYGERPSNLTFLDGRRHDIPLKNNFADYLLLEGFPKGVSEEETLLECFRVLKKTKGHLIVRVPSVMTIEKRPKFTTLAEFASKLFYDFSGQDRLISIERVKEILSKHFTKASAEEEARGNVVFYAELVKKEKVLEPIEVDEYS